MDAAMDAELLRVTPASTLLRLCTAPPRRPAASSRLPSLSRTRAVPERLLLAASPVAKQELRRLDSWFGCRRLPPPRPPALSRAPSHPCRHLFGRRCSSSFSPRARAAADHHHRLLAAAHPRPLCCFVSGHQDQQVRLHGLYVERLRRPRMHPNHVDPRPPSVPLPPLWDSPSTRMTTTR